MNDAEALNQKPLTVILGERKYEWPVQGRRKSRAMILEVNDLDAFRKENEGSARAGIEIIDRCLDFFYAHNESMYADKVYIDDNAEEVQIVEAFQQIMEMLARPFASLRQQSQTQESKESLTQQQS